jgi:hypothetical protein
MSKVVISLTVAFALVGAAQSAGAQSAPFPPPLEKAATQWLSTSSGDSAVDSWTDLDPRYWREVRRDKVWNWFNELQLGPSYPIATPAHLASLGFRGHEVGENRSAFLLRGVCNGTGHFRVKVSESRVLVAFDAEHSVPPWTVCPLLVELAAAPTDVRVSAIVKPGLSKTTDPVLPDPRSWMTPDSEPQMGQHEEYMPDTSFYAVPNSRLVPAVARLLDKPFVPLSPAEAADLAGAQYRAGKDDMPFLVRGVCAQNGVFGIYRDGRDIFVRYSALGQPSASALCPLVVNVPEPLSRVVVDMGGAL